jgi:hypothetical protein
LFGFSWRAHPNNGKHGAKAAAGPNSFAADDIKSGGLRLRLIRISAVPH